MGAAGAMERELLEAFEAARKAADAVGEAAAAAGAGEGVAGGRALRRRAAEAARGSRHHRRPRLHSGEPRRAAPLFVVKTPSAGAVSRLGIVGNLLWLLFRRFGRSLGEVSCRGRGMWVPGKRF